MKGFVSSLFLLASLCAAAASSSLDAIVVKHRSGVDFELRLRASAQGRGERLGGVNTALSTRTILTTRGSEAVAYWSKVPGVEWAEPVMEVSIAQTATPWGVQKVGAPLVWPLATGKNIVVAVLDTGITPTHTEFVGRILSGKNFTSSNVADVVDRHGHGTHVSGTVAGRTVGVAPQAHILPVKVLGDGGTGSTEWISNGITWATDNGARIINLSLGLEGISLLLFTAVEYAISRGVIVVAAAGNNGNTNVFYPAAAPGVISVTAVDQNDNRPGFANYGNWIKMAAPGTNIVSSTRDGKYGAWQGTSMAAPHVSGAAALLYDRLGWGSPSHTERVLTSFGKPLSWHPGRRLDLVPLFVTGSRLVGPQVP